MKPASPTIWNFGGTGGGRDGGHSDGGRDRGHSVGKGVFRLPEPGRAHLMLVAAVTEREDAFAISMLVGSVIAQAGRPVLVCEPRSGRRRAAGPFSTAPARGLAEIVAARFDDLTPVSRGAICHLSLPDDRGELPGRLERLSIALPTSAVCLVSLPATVFRHLLEAGGAEIDSALVLAELPRDRALAALVCGELSERGIRCRVWRSVLRTPRRQLALAGMAPGGAVGAAARRLVSGLDLVSEP